MRVIFLSLMILQGGSFKKEQRQFNRVKTAYEEKEKILKQYFAEKKLNYNTFHIFLRAFKKEEELEVWVRAIGSDKFQLLHTYDFCTTSGTLGPKRKEGDLQIPEGVYHINHFNPQSKFYLSLGLNYPNSSDKILSDKQHPGGSIYIHGSCVTIGCIPITDDKIKELYVLAVEARSYGQQKIPIHIFPVRLSDAGLIQLKSEYAASANISFWENLQTIYEDFDNTKKLREIKVDKLGKYTF